MSDARITRSSPAGPDAQRARTPVAALWQRRSHWGIYIGFAALLLLAELVSPAFLSPSNLSNILEQVAPLGIVVIGQTLVILVRGLDLSVASVMATSAVVATGFSGQDSDIAPIVLVSLAIGIATGLVNGLLVTKRSVSPFLATLAT